jgi:hypothetical protein
MEAMERVGKMQGTNVPALSGTNVPMGTKVPFSTFVPVNNFKNIFEKLTYFWGVHMHFLQV